MQGQVVALFRDRTAAEGQDDTVLGTRFGDARRLDVAKHVFAVLREDLRNGFPGRFGDGAVEFDDVSAGLLREEFRDGGLATAGHADEDEVRGVSGEFGGQVFDDFVIDLRVEEELVGADRLGDEHPEAVGVGDAERLRLQQQAGAQGVIDDVHHTGQALEGREVRDGREVVGVHADGRRVDDDVGVVMARQVVVGDERQIATPSADDQDFTGFFAAQGLEDRFAGASVTEDQHLFAGDVDAVRLEQVQEPEDVGVLGDELPVSAVQRVRRSDGFHRRREFVDEGQDGLFVGDGHVESPDVLLTHEGFQFLRCQFVKRVGFIAEGVVQEGGEAVAEVFPEKAVDVAHVS